MNLLKALNRKSNACAFPTGPPNNWPNLKPWSTENADGTVAAEAYFVLYVVDREGISRMHVCGEYHDVLIRVDGELRLERHLAVVDSETLPANMGVLL